MIACPSCGYPNDEDDYRCERCGRRFETPALEPLPSEALWPEEENEPEETGPAAAFPPDSPPAASSAGSLVEHPWRREVSSRVERFRERRRAQASLPLDFGEPGGPAAVPGPLPVLPLRLEPLGKLIRFEEIPGARVVRSEPSAGAGKPEAVEEKTGRNSASMSPQTAPAKPEAVRSRAPEPAPQPPPRRRVSVPRFTQASLSFPEPRPPDLLETVETLVAPLTVRLIAAAADAFVLACGAALFLVAYATAGGRFAFQRTALLALAASLLLLAFTYSFLFLRYSAATPGMRWVGLRLVDFEGNPPRRSQRSLRLLGLVASGAALGVGFVWAAVDEEGLTWHDRISRTCLTMDDSTFLKRLP